MGEVSVAVLSVYSSFAHGSDRSCSVNLTEVYNACAGGVYEPTVAIVAPNRLSRRSPSHITALPKPRRW